MTAPSFYQPSDSPQEMAALRPDRGLPTLTVHAPAAVFREHQVSEADYYSQVFVELRRQVPNVQIARQVIDNDAPAFVSLKSGGRLSGDRFVITAPGLEGEVSAAFSHWEDSEGDKQIDLATSEHDGEGVLLWQRDRAEHPVITEGATIAGAYLATVLRDAIAADAHAMEHDDLALDGDALAVDEEPVSTYVGDYLASTPEEWLALHEDTNAVAHQLMRQHGRFAEDRVTEVGERLDRFSVVVGRKDETTDQLIATAGSEGLVVSITRGPEFAGPGKYRDPSEGQVVARQVFEHETWTLESLSGFVAEHASSLLPSPTVRLEPVDPPTQRDLDGPSTPGPLAQLLRAASRAAGRGRRLGADPAEMTQAPAAQQSRRSHQHRPQPGLPGTPGLQL